MRYILTFFFLIATAGCFAQSDAVTFILVRHAEKETNVGGDQMMAKDPPLSKAGAERAVRLKELLDKQPITVILSTNYKRTLTTVQPTADAKGLTVQTYESLKSPQMEELINKHKGGTVLISGHSNTIPGFANLLLGSNKFANYEDSDYGNILIITVTPIGKGNVTHLRY
jgi:2,3-bisphosphoglycerate-dependent phosphoglycerate mutase